MGSRPREHKLCRYQKHYVRLSRDYSFGRVAAVVGLEKRIDMVGLRSAVLKMENRHPAMRSKLKTWSSLVEVEESDRPEGLVSVIEHQRESSSHWFEEWNNIHVNPVEIGECPFLIVALNSTEEEGPSELMLLVHHYIIDGVSIFALMDELLGFMADPSLESEPKNWNLNVEELIQKTLKSRLKQWRISLKYLNLEVYSNLFRKEKGHVKTSASVKKDAFRLPGLTAYETLSPEDVRKLKNYAKSNYGATLNVVLTVALNYALNELSQSNEIEITPLYDLRRHQAQDIVPQVEANDISFLTSTIPFRFRVDKNRNKWEVLKEVKKKYDNLDKNLLIGAPNFQRYSLRLLPVGPRISPTAIMSNVGKAGVKPFYEGLGNVTFARMLLNNNSVTCPYVSFVSHNGTLGITVMGTPRFYDQDTVHTLAMGIKEQLKSMIDTSSLQGLS